MILNICIKFREDICNGFHVKQRHLFVTELHIIKSYGCSALQVTLGCLILSWNFMNISWTVLKLWCRHDFVKEIATYNVQRDETQKASIQELWFLQSACRLMLVNIHMKIHEDILNGFKDIVRKWFCHRTANYKLQRDVTQKIHIQELWFLHSACHLLVLNICMKFYEYILNSFKVIEQTRFCHATAT